MGVEMATRRVPHTTPPNGAPTMWQPSHSTPIIRQYHPTVDGSMGRVAGFFMVWGNRSQAVLFDDITGRRGSSHVLWQVRFGSTIIEVIGVLTYKADGRGAIKTLHLHRNDGREFPASFKVFYMH